MSLIVQKFCGSSVTDAESIKCVAKRIVAARTAGHVALVVVSAMGDRTDELTDFAHQVTPTPDACDMATLLATGDRILRRVARRQRAGAWSWIYRWDCVLTGTIRRERERVRRLAERLGVSPATVQGSERLEVEGRIQIETLRRALGALGARVRVDATPRTPSRLARREGSVALELHKLVAAPVLRDPENALARVPFVNCAHASPGRSYTASLLDAWSETAEARDISGLLHAITSTDARPIDMRQSGPFNGVLSEVKRRDAIAKGALMEIN